MTLYIKQKMFKLFDEFEVYNEQGETVYKVKNYGMLSHQFEFINLKTNKVYQIKESVFRLFNRFEIINSNGELIDTAVQDFGLFSLKIYLEKLGWKLKSSWPAISFSCTDRDGTIILSVEKEIFSFTDYYKLDINEMYNVDLLVILMICMDALMCRN